MGEIPKIELTEKEEAFCNAYLIDFNGAKAARMAGYSESSAKEIASQNLTKLHIRARITELRQQMGKAYNVTRERIAQELARIGFLDIRNVFDEQGRLKDPREWSDEEAAAIAGLETEQTFEGYGDDRTWTGYLKKVKLTDKRAALDSLAKLMGYNEPEKHELIGQLGITWHEERTYEKPGPTEFKDTDPSTL
jgi:phage terminase small subunit